AIRMGPVVKRLRVVGVASSPEYMYPVREKGDMPSPRAFAPVFIPQPSLERLVGRPSTINEVAVRVRPGADARTVAKRVERVLDHYGVGTSVLRADQASAFMLTEEIEQNRVMAVFLPMIILAISTASMFITLSRLVTGQRGEIGLAKALGYSDAQLFAHYLLFSVFVAGFGALIGIVFGDVLARAMAQQYVDILGVPLLDHHVYPLVIGAAVLVSLAACGLAGVVPAWRAVRIAPAEAMHADPNAALAGGRVPLPERLLSRVLPRSLTFRIPLRNVFRSRRRSLYTIAGIAFALIITVATQASFDSIDMLLEKVPSFSERWDVSAGFETPVGAARVSEIARWAGVESAQGALVLPATVTHEGRSHEGMITAADPDATFHGFKIVGGEPVAGTLGAGGLVLPSGIA
ncbi:MAG: FtsX-like permease family protein, partial [Actinobacteria bacterium]